MREIPPNGYLPPDHADKSKGRLCYSESLLFGRNGSALMAEFPNRQYSRNQKRHRPLSEELSVSINWRIVILRATAPRQVQLKQKNPILSYDDASGLGGAGAVIFSDCHSISTHTHLPAWLVMANGIYEFEIAVMIYALLIAHRRYWLRVAQASCAATIATPWPPSQEVSVTPPPGKCQRWFFVPYRHSMGHLFGLKRRV